MMISGCCDEDWLSRNGSSRSVVPSIAARIILPEQLPFEDGGGQHACRSGDPC
jgi:hypothetical protein